MLMCGCDAHVLWRIPIMFVYRVVVDRQSSSCPRHRPGTRWFVGLETIESSGARHASTQE
jgi:hypothetical protein